MVRSLILNFSLSLAVCLFFPRYLNLLFLATQAVEECWGRILIVVAVSWGTVLKIKQSCGSCSVLTCREFGEKLKESTEEVGDRLLQALT